MFDKLLTNFKQIRQKRVRRLECNVPFCDRAMYSKGFCSMHYQRDRILASKNVTKDTDFVEWYSSMHRWRNSKTRDADGAPLPCGEKDCDWFV